VPADLASQLARWQSAGLIDANQAQAIADFESSTPPTPDGARDESITAIEVITYAGALVTLVGLATLLGTQYGSLGPLGRLGIPGLVAAAAIGLSWALPRDRGRARRAQTALLTLAVVAIGFFTGQAQVELEGGPSASIAPDTGYRILLVASLVSAALGAFFLSWTHAGLLAVALTVALLVAGASFNALTRPSGWGFEVVYLGVGLLLLSSAEYARGLRIVWATEILAFGGLLIPVVAAFFAAGDADLPLELLGGALAALAFVAAVTRGSAGYAIAGGLGLFGFVLDIELRHFQSSLGFSVSLVIAGLALLAIGYLLARVVPGLRSDRLKTGRQGPTLQP
jgi:predicted membrane protein DUF2157